MDEQVVVAIGQREMIIFLSCWLFAASSGLTYAITESHYSHIGKLVALGAYSGFIGLCGGLAVYSGVGDPHLREFLALLVATYLGSLGKQVDKYRSLPMDWIKKKYGIEVGDDESEKRSDH